MQKLLFHQFQDVVTLILTLAEHMYMRTFRKIMSATVERHATVRCFSKYITC